MGLRDKCDNRKRCGKTGHHLVKGGYVRCKCLELEINERRLGQMYCENPRMDSPMIGKREKDLRIEGPLDTIRPHVAGALLNMVQKKETFVLMDAYRLIEIFLEKDSEYSTSLAAIEADLFILLLGFGDPPNRYLPELLMQAMNRRSLMRKPTWVIMGLELSRVGHKYSAELQEHLERFERVGTK